MNPLLSRGRQFADKAGLSIGDVLVQFNGEPVENLNELHRLLTSDMIDKTVDVGTDRGRQKLQMKISPVELTQP